MKRAVLPILLAMLAFVAAASAPGLAADGSRPRFGVSEDAAKYADDGGQTMYDDLKQLGMTEVKFVVFWNADQPTTIQEKAFLDRSVPVAAKNGISVIFAVTHQRATMLTSSPAAPDQFAAYLAQLARTYPSVKEFIVGNEPNQPRFFQPQFTGGKNVSAALYTNILAKGYDALKAVDPNILVVGVGLSPRGNDLPNAPSNVSTSPTRFIKYMGDAYRASGRTRPLMDLFGLHLYPDNPSKDTPDTEARWPNVSFATLTRLQQAMWDGFHGTAQPTFVESASARSLAADVPPSLQWKLDELGWQTEVAEAHKAFYSGQENVEATSEEAQARHYATMVKRALCNSAIAELLFFHLIDEADLDRFQSGLKRADGSPKPAFEGVAQEVAKNCESVTAEARWSHSNTVQVTIKLSSPNLGTNWRYPKFTSATVEDAAREALYIRVDDKTFDPRDSSDRARLGQLFTAPPKRALQARVRGLTILGRSSASLKAYVTQTVKAPRGAAGNLPPGTYVQAVLTRAWANPERTSLWVSPLIKVPKR